MDISNYYIPSFPLFYCLTLNIFGILWDTWACRNQAQNSKKMVVGGCVDSLHRHMRKSLHPMYRKSYTQRCVSSKHKNKFTNHHNPWKFNEWPKKSKKNTEFSDILWFQDMGHNFLRNFLLESMLQWGVDA